MTETLLKKQRNFAKLKKQNTKRRRNAINTSEK